MEEPPSQAIDLEPIPNQYTKPPVTVWLASHAKNCINAAFLWFVIANVTAPLADRVAWERAKV
jgi:hypothetical protein